MLLCDKSFDHPGIFSAGFVIKLRDQRSTTPENQDAWATKLFTVAPDICGFSERQSFQFAYLAPNILRWPAEREANNPQLACDPIFLFPPPLPCRHRVQGRYFPCIFNIQIYYKYKIPFFSIVRK